MAYSRTHKQTDSEKRLKALRQQLYGKEVLPKDFTSITSQVKTTSYDLGSLKKDLTKISLLAILGITLQLVIYFALKNNLISVPF